MAEEGNTQVPPRRTFVQLLMEHRHGALIEELTTYMLNLTNEVRDQQKSGSLVITLKVEPTKDPNMISLMDNVTLKSPKHTPGASMFFLDTHGFLFRSDPNQPELPLQEVPRRESQEFKEVN